MSDRAMTVKEMYELLQELQEGLCPQDQGQGPHTTEPSRMQLRGPIGWQPQGYTPAPMRLTEREKRARPGEMFRPTGTLAREVMALLSDRSPSRTSRTPLPHHPSRASSTLNLEPLRSCMVTGESGKER